MAAPQKKSSTATVVASKSKLKPGIASRRVKTRFIVIYGPAKSRKTGACRNLPRGRTKWLISDPNCIPTLTALGALPHPDDTHEVSSLAAARSFVGEALDLVEKEGVEALGIDFLVVDSITQFADWHEDDVAQATGQQWLGQNTKDGGWVRFNAEFGKLLDDLTTLSKHITVVAIAHAAKAVDLKKGEWSGIALRPAMMLKLSRLANWLLFKELKTFNPPDDLKEDEYITIKEERGQRVAYENIIHTRPVGLWQASANAQHLNAEEPGDLAKMLEKEGLL